VSGLVVAARYLTIVPLPGRSHVPPAALGAAAAWFPVIGLLLGAGLIVVDAVAVRLFPGLLAALLTVTAWKLLTGGLHLDGLADCLDGLMGRDREHRLAIMRDSRIGTFGAVGLILFLMLEIVAVSELPPGQRWRALLVVPAIGRATPPLLARLVSAARPNGQGAAFLASVPTVAVPLAVLGATLAAVAFLGVAGFVAAVIGLAAAVVVARLAAARLGGVTGDVLGAAVEVAELAALLAAIAWRRLGS
jgi:adenosylcobinamide-GDP ribazoletransferase